MYIELNYKDSRTNVLKYVYKHIHIRDIIITAVATVLVAFITHLILHE